jgi:hypothetical protein
MADGQVLLLVIVPASILQRDIASSFPVEIKHIKTG